MRFKGILKLISFIADFQHPDRIYWYTVLHVKQPHKCTPMAAARHSKRTATSENYENIAQTHSLSTFSIAMRFESA